MDREAKPLGWSRSIQGDLATEAAVAAMIVRSSGTDVDAWARRSLEHGVSWYTGRRYAFDQQPRPFARLGFASLNEREISEAVKRMAAARR